MGNEFIKPEFFNKLKSDETLQKAVKDDPVSALKQYVETKDPLSTDNWIYRIVVISLGLTVILCTIFSFLLAQTPNSETPQILIALGSAAVGALAGLLAPSPKSKE